jgi:hypothetical protein
MAKKDKDESAKQEEPGESSIAVNDAWTGMLAISLLALVIGTGFLAWDFMQYSDQDPPPMKKVAGAPPNPVNPPKKAEEAPKDGAPK